ncbi:hypothetical protein IQ07DRAFT_641787 [Pyrenochaeta sp. DS3sAY3a]|nr:hypothetical protein IQ07DRAFT_641787 [Pyrenochaeta sp. DS3sAY3a]
MECDATLPSSPPQATMADLPEFPPFDLEQGFAPLSPKSSSPPPLFSSDDSRESVDVTNYQSPRIFKNKRKGAWWANGEAAHNEHEPKKSKLSRNFDSGVYMMSDASESSESFNTPDNSESIALHRSPFAFDGACDPEPKPRWFTPTKSAFCQKLHAGLEKNVEIYNWERLNLQDHEIEQIGHLASVIRVPPDAGTEVPAEGAYRSLDPNLIVHLGENKLCRLTPSLFTLQFLTHLNLSNNRIKELPQLIGQLRELRSLNLTHNELTCLPFEVLRLHEPYGNLGSVHTYNNPMIRPKSCDIFLPARLPLEFHLPHDDRSDNTHYDVALIRAYEYWINEHKAESAGKVTAGFYSHHPAVRVKPGVSESNTRIPVYIARSLVSYYDETGNVLPLSARLPSSTDEETPCIIDTEGGAYGVPSAWYSPPSVSPVPSLVTTSINSVLHKRHNDDMTIQDILSMFKKDRPMPRTASIIFSKAIANAFGGYSEFRQCHVCKKDYIIPRAEWVEFWWGLDFRLYPFKISVCSWSCVPEEVRKKPEKELTF